MPTNFASMAFISFLMISHTSIAEIEPFEPVSSTKNQQRWIVKAIFYSSEQSKACGVIAFEDTEGFFCAGDPVEKNVLVSAVNPESIVLATRSGSETIFMQGDDTPLRKRQPRNVSTRKDVTNKTGRTETTRKATTSPEEDSAWFKAVYRHMQQQVQEN